MIDAKTEGFRRATAALADKLAAAERSATIYSMRAALAERTWQAIISALSEDDQGMTKSFAAQRKAVNPRQIDSSPVGDVQRWHGDQFGMTETSDGGWVKRTDHAEVVKYLTAERDALRARIEHLESCLQTFGYDDNWIDSDGYAAWHNKDQEPAAIARRALKRQ